MAPGGWIARCDPDGSNIEIVSSGYRNQYDIAMDAEGEIFTYDADMEWDLGSPWYRPTRVCHVTSGSEFGWRSGTGKWPVHYEDSLPPVVEIGPGSPTGVLFGTGAHFPARYQRALFVLDWTFGTIYAVHLEPDGASFKATKEDFAWSKPWAVNDAVIGADGAMYVTVVAARGRRSTDPLRGRGVHRSREVRASSGEERAARAARSRRSTAASTRTPSRPPGPTWLGIFHPLRRASRWRTSLWRRARARRRGGRARRGRHGGSRVRARRRTSSPSCRASSP